MTLKELMNELKAVKHTEETGLFADDFDERVFKIITTHLDDPGLALEVWKAIPDDWGCRPSTHPDPRIHASSNIYKDDYLYAWLWEETMEMHNIEF